jgi:SAM-dependent methyltransferase
MSRKERRAAGALGAAQPDGPAASTAAPERLARLFDAAAAHHRAGAIAEAERSYRDILTLFPTHAETLSRLGAVLMAQGNASEAIATIERSLSIVPDQFEAIGNLAQAYLATGQGAQAASAAARALELQETTLSKMLFAHCARKAVFRSDKDGRARKLVLRALLEDWAPPRALTGAVLSLIKLDSAINDCVARVNSAWPARLPAAELLGLPGLADLARDQLLRGLLERDPVTDIGFERLLTNVRYAMLTTCAKQEEWDEGQLHFFCTVARQCFLNEYVYALPESEAVQAIALQSALSDRIKAGEPVPAPWLVAVAAYFPLHILSDAAALGERTWPQCVEALIVQQIREPAEERQIAASLPVLTGIDDEVSRAVRRQYEENPYPRWVRAVPTEKTALAGERMGPVRDVLIAGCGTGLSAVETLRAGAKTRILAIDLSLASLSYAKRMAEKLSLNDVEFAQADILKLDAIERQFDFIDASGVLHHLADPWQGWQVLLSLLRPGGTMQLGLYSDIARRNVAAARALIAERGYRPTPQDIRRCREDIIGTDDPALKLLLRSQDFFTTSECRDLLFHVHESRISLPEIKSFVTTNNLTFAGFSLETATLQKFAARFPERAALTDLDRWHAFETEVPDTFLGMYQFQVRKPPLRPDGTPARAN